MFRRIKLSLLSTCVLFLSGCFLPDAIVKSGEVASNLMVKKLVSSHQLSNHQTRVHYVARNSNSKNLIVFIHGTPGDWRIFSPQLDSETLVERASLVALDRPGWGASKIFNDDGDLSLAKQSALIGPILSDLRNKYNSNNLVLVGHSLGGSLVPRIAIDHPLLVDAVVVLAGDLSDEYPAAYWYNNIASWRIFSWLIPAEMAKANDEVLALNESLADMKPDWKNLHAPLLVVQGSKDGLVDPRHADFAESLKTRNHVKVVRVEDGDHLVHLKQPERINQLIANVVMRDRSRIFK